MLFRVVYCGIYYSTILFIFFFKQKTAYEMRISDWSSDVCSSDLLKKQRRYPMGEFTEKAKGLANEAAGNAKQATGKATDNERLRAEGEAQERKDRKSVV